MRRALVLALLTLAALPATASAHAQLLSTQPERGTQLDSPRDTVALRFDEPIEASFGAVRVFDPSGKRVDNGRLERPDGDATIGTGVRAAGDGVYTVTYRIISGDGHPVSGGFTYSVGEGGPASTPSVAELLDEQNAGGTTRLAYGVVRALGYLAIALALGAIAFAALCWRRVKASELAKRAFERALCRLILVACVVGIGSSAAAIVLQAAVAAGSSFWDALDPSAISEIASTRTGTALAARLGAWLALTAAVVLARRGWTERAGAPLIALAGIAGLALVVTPGLGGHAGVASPVLIAVLANSVHVAAMSVWIGGIAVLLLAVVAATRAVRSGDRARLLYDVVTRFSQVALIAACVVIVSGLVQTLIDVGSFADLLHTAFGRAILIKVVIVLVLLAIGAANRKWFIPRLAEAKRRCEGPGTAGASLRTALRAEIALMAIVLGVSAALVSYSPAPGSTRLLSETFALGAARTELSVSPLQRGPQEIHLYLFDEQTGELLRRTGEVRASLSLRDRDIGPIDIDLRGAGPGHLTATQTISVAGDWRLTVSRRASRFDSFTHESELTVR